MKKILLATTLIATASTAMADVSFSGYGRFGATYNNKAVQKTQMAGRMRLNIKGSMTTDGGIEFGAKTRLQSNIGALNGTFAGAMFTMDSGAWHVEVGNVNTAFDSASLIWNSEMGFQDSSFGDPTDAVFAYSSDATGLGYSGVSATYTMGSLVVMASAVDPDQTAKATATTETETALSLAYTTGKISLAAAGYHNGAGVKGFNGMFVGAAYAVSDAINVGLNYIDEDAADAVKNPTGKHLGKITTLYGNYKMGAITLRGYVADYSAKGADTAVGLGADYDLGGGARLSGAVQQGPVWNKTTAAFDKTTLAEVGVRFDF